MLFRSHVKGHALFKVHLYLFAFRFFIEFCKEVQVDFEESMALDMGQLLSIPFVVAGVWLMLRSRRKLQETKK